MKVATPEEVLQEPSLEADRGCRVEVDMHPTHAMAHGQRALA